MTTHTAYIAMGSNLGNRIQNCKQALEKIRTHPHLKITKISPWIETEPLGYKNQNKFINGAIKIETPLPPQKLLKTLLDIEKELGRTRSLKWGPRIIDLDILLYDDVSLNMPNLIIPHPEMKRRGFIKTLLLKLNPHLASYF